MKNAAHSLRRAMHTLAAIALLSALPVERPFGASDLLPGVGAASAVATQQDGDPLTSEDVTRIRSVGQVIVSPTGSHVAYTLSIPRTPFEDEDGPAWTELHVLDVASGESRTFVGGHVNVAGIGWAPDGSAITYLARRPGDDRRSLYVIPLAGGESRKMLEHETSIDSYSLSPDGQRVAFVATEPAKQRASELAKQGVKTEVYEEELRFSHVWLAPANLAGAMEMGPARQLAIEGHVSDVEWAPSGERLAVAVAPTPLVDDSYMRKRIRVVDAQSGTVLARIENPGKLGQISWSPDGEHLAIVSAEDINDPSEGRLMIVPARGGELADLIPDFEGHVRGLHWQDAGTLVFLAAEGVYTTLGEVSLDGSDRRTLVEPGGRILNGLSVSRDGRTMAFAGDSPQHANEVFVARFGGQPTRMTDSNPWLATRSLARQDLVEWEARDGLRIEGLLIRPVDEQPGERHPLIVTVHGGPESHYDHGWLTAYSMPGQVAAGRGFAVFYPNYRASTGRGVAFSKMDHKDTAGGEFDDIVDGVDHLVEMGLVDGDRVGVTGGSYGGYATAWLTTRYSDRFAAGVMFVGISNQISKVGTSDIPDEMYLVHQRLRPWDDWEFFLERSPIYWAGQSRTPLLIAHGKEDPRVHPGQSMEMYRNLKLRGEAPVRLIFYPGEGHGNRNAAARYDYSLRQLRWMEHYLMGPGGEKPPFEIEYPLEKKEQESEKVTAARN
jgi:dipeptidyl aminopeptidase/acylaminoacyl peptidase